MFVEGLATTECVYSATKHTIVINTNFVTFYKYYESHYSGGRMEKFMDCDINNPDYYETIPVYFWVEVWVMNYPYPHYFRFDTSEEAIEFFNKLKSGEQK